MTEKNYCKECGRECPVWEEVCLACEMKYDEEKEQKRQMGEDNG